MTVYLDSSALVKLVVREPESAALRTYLRRQPAPRTTSALARTEVVRSVGLTSPAAVPTARRVLAGMHTVAVSRSILDAAGDLAVRLGLRSLDAVHLATAASIGAHVEVLVTYDRRLAAAAESLGLTVAAPGT